MGANKYFKTLVFVIGLLVVYFYLHPKNISAPVVNSSETKPFLFNKNSATTAASSSQIKIDSTVKLTDDGFEKVKKISSRKHIRTPASPIADPTSRLIEVGVLSHTHWKLWPEMSALKTSELTETSKEIAKINNLSVVEAPDENFNLNNFDTAKFAVVYNERLRKPGLITGTIMIQTSEKNKLQQDLELYQMQINDSFENINTYFVKSQNSVFNLEYIFEQLKLKKYIQHIELEIIYKNYEKN